MTQNEMVQPDTRTHKEKRKELARNQKRKDCRKIKETEDFSSLDPNKTKMMLAEEGDDVH
jgi:hypothetical protein